MRGVIFIRNLRGTLHFLLLNTKGGVYIWNEVPEEVVEAGTITTFTNIWTRKWIG